MSTQQAQASTRDLVTMHQEGDVIVGKTGGGQWFSAKDDL